jgi:hypothetical protein
LKGYRNVIFERGRKNLSFFFSGTGEEEEARCGKKYYEIRHALMGAIFHFAENRTLKVCF